MSAAFVSQPAPGALLSWRAPHAHQLGCPRCVSRPTSTALSYGVRDLNLSDTNSRSPHTGSPDDDDGVQGAARRQVQDFFVDFDATTRSNGEGAVDFRSRWFVSKINQMPGYDWKGVLRELESIEHASKLDAASETIEDVRGKLDAASVDDSVSLASYAAVLCHIAKCARWQEGLQILERIREAGSTPDELCVGPVLRACNQAGQWQRTVQLLGKARCWGTELGVASYNTAIRACRGLGQWEESVAILRKMPTLGVAPDVLSYNSAISACAKGRRGGEAVSLLREMSMSTVGVAPDATTYSLAIAACGKGGRWEKAVALLREMPTAGVVPNVLSYTSAILACAKGCQWKQATSLLGEMSAAGLVPDEIAYSSVISACGKAGQWRQAVALLREMPTIGVAPDLASYNATIVACGKGGQWEQAVALVREMLAAGVVPDALSYASAISACEDGGQHEHALALRKEMLEAGIRAGDNISAPCCTAAEAFGREGQREGAAIGPSAEIPTASIIGTAGIRNGSNDSFTLKLGDRTKKRDRPVALLLLRDMPSLGVTPTATAYEAAIRACREGGHWKEAVALLAEMSEAGIRPGVDSYSAAIAACVAGGQEEEAVALFGQMSVVDKAALLARQDRDLSGLLVALGGGVPTLQVPPRPPGKNKRLRAYAVFTNFEKDGCAAG